jgi:hypothetical protein
LNKKNFKKHLVIFLKLKNIGLFHISTIRGKYDKDKGWIKDNFSQEISWFLQVPPLLFSAVKDTPTKDSQEMSAILKFL